MIITRVKRGAVVSADHHLVSWIRCWGRLPDRQTVKVRWSILSRWSSAQTSRRASPVSWGQQQLRAEVRGSVVTVVVQPKKPVEGIINEGGLPGLFSSGTLDSAERYQQARRPAASVVMEVKTQLWEESGEAMDKNS